MPAPDANAMLAMQFQLRQSQWLSPEELLKRQLIQLSPLYNHAYNTMGIYASKYRDVGLNRAHSTLSIDEWREIPIITRSEIQQAGEHFISNSIPRAHGPVETMKTSGSTGKPIVIYNTAIVKFFWNVFTLRDHLWHKRDFGKKLGIIRWIVSKDEARAPDGLHLPGWGESTDVAYQTGPSSVLSLRSSLEEQYRWLKRENPGYLLTYATNALELAKYFKERGETLSKLKQVRTLSEAFGPDLRASCADAWQASVVDMYTARETGYLALQCPDHEHYHAQSENVLIEILDDEGKPCEPGQVGRVVISTLHNWASPLLRYEIGDYAELGEPCSCGRGLPVIRQIKGRVRNMLILPNGQKFWPVMGSSKYSNIAPIKQLQFIQRVVDRLEIRMVLEREMTPDEKRALTLAIQESMGHPFELDYIICDEIGRGASGKYEEFLSELNNASAGQDSTI